MVPEEIKHLTKHWYIKWKYLNYNKKHGYNNPKPLCFTSVTHQQKLGVGGWENDSLTKSYLDQNSEEGTDRVNLVRTILIPASVEAWRSWGLPNWTLSSPSPSHKGIFITYESKRLKYKNSFFLTYLFFYFVLLNMFLCNQTTLNSWWDILLVTHSNHTQRCKITRPGPAHLGSGAGLHGAELLVPLGVPQLVQRHIQHHQQLQTPPGHTNIFIWF